ncbi:hypothetical protein [Pseudooceanicola aestuarii]|uniref:hypothetical protein n=1 Tax=Pseudooceanicola aestuarii TaxID=2697319 RepID=UPI001EF98166|nr:hypothetical protein [Pseudooceanicola aestuarii]
MGLTLALSTLSGAAVAQETGERPISAIDWLNRDVLPAPHAAPRAGIGSTTGLNGVARPGADPTFGLDLDGAALQTTGRFAPPGEPPVASTAQRPEVRTSTLDETRAGGVGLLPQAVTGLPLTLWSASEAEILSRRIGGLDVAGLPAMQSLLYSLLLAEADPPRGEGRDPVLLQARVDKLYELGAVDPALALLARAGPDRHEALFARWFDLSLLAGTEDEACTRLIAAPDLSPGYAEHIFCLARTGDWETAALTFGSVSALGLLDPSTEGLLLRFLDVGMDEDAVALPPPSQITPLAFRLQEAIGEPLPAAALPRAFAMTDLRNVSGWKAEIEAAERLARTGAMPENRLLGVYSDRKPAASGGIWDRVAAIQRFDAAIQSRRDADRALAALPEAWTAMRRAELEVPFSRLYGPALARITPASGPARALAFRIALLSDDYEAAAGQLKPATPTERFLLGLTRGEPAPDDVIGPRAAAIARGFDLSRPLPRGIRAHLDAGRLGEAIVEAMALYTRAASGEWKDISDALATFRHVGLEDTARRAALQMMILDRAG